MATFYYSTPGGGVAFREVAETVINPDPDAPVVPGWTEITSGAYESALASIEAADEAAREAKADASEAGRQAAYNDLKASAHTVDWDDATVRLITGYYGA